MAEEAVALEQNLLVNDTVVQSEKRERISALFSELASNLSHQYPPIPGGYSPQLKGEGVTFPEEQVKSAKLLLEMTTPEELTNIIIENPPTIFIKKSTDPSEAPTALKPSIALIPPTKEESTYAEKAKKISLKYKNDEMTSFVFDRLNSYLSTPRIRDSFTDHRLERSPWERGILNALRVLDEITETDSGVPKGEWGDKFEEFFNTNKYTIYKRSPIQSGIQMLLSLRPELATKLGPIYKNLEQRASYKGDNFDENTDIFVKDCMQIIDAFE